MTYEHSYRSPILLSRFAIAGVALTGLCALLSAMIGVAQIIDPDRVIELGDESTSVWFLVQGLLAVLQFGVYLFAAVMFLIWLHRVYTNLPALRSDNTEFTPGWAVGWWFIPFANFVKPFQAVRNAWAESDPDVDLEGGFLTGVQAGAPLYMGFWWAAWILANISTNVSSRLWDPDDVSAVAVLGYVFTLTGILWAVGAGLAVTVILDITSRQEARFLRLGELAAHQPPPPPSFGQQYGMG